MIGNDVVDVALSRIESNWQRIGISNKLFTKKEQQLIANSCDSEVMFWTLWSRKEAVYKIIAREHNFRKFIPLQIECQTPDDVSDVVYNGVTYYVNSTFENEVIHSVAVNKYANLKLVTELEENCRIRKKGVYPFVFDKAILYPISISHHGMHRKAVRLKPT